MVENSSSAVMLSSARERKCGELDFASNVTNMRIIAVNSWRNLVCLVLIVFHPKSYR